MRNSGEIGVKALYKYPCEHDGLSGLLDMISILVYMNSAVFAR